MSLLWGGQNRRATPSTPGFLLELAGALLLAAMCYLGLVLLFSL